MNQKDTLVGLIEQLELHQIPYFITGSFASNLHGTPRMTQDADIIIHASLNQLLKLSQDLSKEYYVSDDAIKEAVQQEKMFNVIHFQEGYKFDLIPLKSDPFDQSRFKRRLSVPLEGKSLFFSSAEDIILAKLQWALSSGSERQIDDAKGIISVQGDRLNWAYLNEWAERLGVMELLEKISG